MGDAGMSRWAMTAMQVPPESDTSQSGNKRGEDYGRSAAQEPFKSALSYRNHLRSGVWHACIGGLNFRPLFRVLFRALAGVDFCRMQTHIIVHSARRPPRRDGVSSKLLTDTR